MANGPRYEQIILSSIKVFARTNFEKATTAMIASEAGVAEGTLYKYFPSKKELFLACSHYVEEQLIERYRAIYREKKDQPVEYLRGVTRSYLDFVVENPNMRKFLAFMLNNTFDEDFRAELERFVKLNVQATEKMIRLGVEKGEITSEINPHGAAWMFVGGYFTLILMAEVGDAASLSPGYLDSLFLAVVRPV